MSEISYDLLLLTIVVELFVFEIFILH